MITFADRFVLEHELGSGGMARVYLGRDEVLDRPVAVKVLNPVHGGTEIGDRFEREGRTAARLAHPNIVQVYDAGEALFDGRETSYIVMEYVPGGDLKALIDRRGRLSGSELAGLGDEVCAGLAHAHERGVIHRDIKPHNILLDENGHAKVTDFGIARALDTTQATRTGSFLGTALYSSPEQLQGKKVTPKSDVYSLGATLYQAADGDTALLRGDPHRDREPARLQSPGPPASARCRRERGRAGPDPGLPRQTPGRPPDGRRRPLQARSGVPRRRARATAGPGNLADSRKNRPAPSPHRPRPGRRVAAQCAQKGKDGGRGFWPSWRSWPCSPWWEPSPRRTSSEGTGGPAMRVRTTRRLGGNEGRSGGQPGGGPGNDQGSQGSGGDASSSATASASAGPSASPQSSSSPVLRGTYRNRASSRRRPRKIRCRRFTR